MSHELRTPLSAVIGYTELLEEDAEDGGDTAVLSDLAKIKANAKHLLGLINDILDLSKVEANKMELIVEEIDLPRSCGTRPARWKRWSDARPTRSSSTWPTTSARCGPTA